MQKVVVLMSTYNGEKYLREQIDSILAQQDCEVQLCVRDDGSKDTTTQILDEYKSKGQLDWYSGENLGPGKSFFELSLHVPDAEYYAFADQDDYWKPDKLSCAINMIEAEKCKDIPTLYCSKFTATDAELNPLTQQENRIYGKITLGHALVENIAPGCTFVFSKRAMQLFQKFNIENIDIHDWVLYRVVLAVGGKVLYDNVSHILYRQHGNNNIGIAESSLKKSFIHRSQNRKSYSKIAKSLLAIYKTDIKPHNLKLLEEVSGYTENVGYKTALIFSNKLFMSGARNNLLLKFLLIFNWL